MNEQMLNMHEKQVEHLAANQDFFRHINGEWLNSTEIPPSKARWGAFDKLRQQTRDRMGEIAEAADSLTGAEKGSDEQLVGDFYHSYVDMDTRNRLGITPLDSLRSQIASVETPTELAACMAEMMRQASGTLFGFDCGEDRRNAGKNITYIGQGGIGLPDREYYLKNDDESREIQQKYRQYTANLLSLAGRDDHSAAAAAESVYELESKLASASRTRAEARQRDKNYTKMSIDELKANYPDFAWDRYFSVIGAPDVNEVVVRQPEFLECVNSIVRDGDIQTLRDYLECSLLRAKAPSLSQDFIDADFDFYDKTLSGKTEQEPIKDRAMMAIGSTDLTNAIGPIYCERYFDEADKARLTQIVADVRAAFARRVEGLDWMAPKTKALTLQKLDNIDFKMGFPDQWLDLSSVDIQPDTYAANSMKLRQFLVDRNVAQIGQDYDRSEWSMAPTTVNACADLKRDMTFPAAILQAPFYDSGRDDAYNYGAIGMVIGHELSHFFDDQGSKYDHTGNLNDWWSNTDRDQFEARARDFVAYYSQQSADSLQVNGELTQGENIADIAGIKIAFDAYVASQARAEADESLDGLTPEQRFFTGYAKIWAIKVRPEHAEQMITVDTHSPGEVRVNAVLAINTDFHDAFDVQPGDDMYVPIDKRPELW